MTSPNNEDENVDGIETVTNLESVQARRMVTFQGSSHTRNDAKESMATKSCFTSTPSRSAETAAQNKQRPSDQFANNRLSDQRLSAPSRFPQSSREQNDLQKNSPLSLRKRSLLHRRELRRVFDVETGCQSTRERCVEVVYTSGSGKFGMGGLMDFNSPIPKIFSKRRLSLEKNDEGSHSVHSATDNTIPTLSLHEFKRNSFSRRKSFNKTCTRVYRVRSKAMETRSKFAIIFSGLFSTRTVSDYFRWTFRASFCCIAFSVYILFVLCILFFAIIIYIIGMSESRCVVVEGMDFREAGGYFMDSVHLSWITFSTVGYGVASSDTRNGCLGVQILMAYESFLGILFSAIILSIIVGKVARVQSVAQVQFSNQICIQYTPNISSSESPAVFDNNDQSENVDDETGASRHSLPCPILEFRIMNDLSATVGGEIIDATVSVVAVKFADVDEKDEKYYSSQRSNLLQHNGGIISSLRPSSARSSGENGKSAMHFGRRSRKHSGGFIQRLNERVSQPAAIILPGSEDTDVQPISTESENNISEVNVDKTDCESGTAHNGLNEENGGHHDNEVSNQERSDDCDCLNDHKKRHHSYTHLPSLPTITVDEGSKLVPAQSYHKVSIETNKHPYFKRIWTIRHRLDATSPLLSRRARRAIKENGGFWPSEWHHASNIRENLIFNEIVVNFSGTANVSSNSVFAVKLYDIADVNIGYTYADALVRLPTGQLIADSALLSNIVEQRGGGGEPLSHK